jgi:hypothetical protein
MVNSSPWSVAVWRSVGAVSARTAKSLGVVDEEHEAKLVSLEVGHVGIFRRYLLSDLAVGAVAQRGGDGASFCLGEWGLVGPVLRSPEAARVSPARLTESWRAGFRCRGR